MKTAPKEATPPASASAPRKWVSREFRSLGGWESLDSLKRIIKEVDEAIASGDWKDFSLDIRMADYSDSQYMYMIGHRLEDDKEYAVRIDQEAKWKVEQEKRDQAEFNRLKQKFQEKK